MLMESTAVVKAFALLEAAAGAPEGVGLAELASTVGLNKPTAHRILKTLSALGYVERLGFGQYRQTLQVRRLIGGEVDDRVLSAAAAHLEKLHRKTLETVNLGALRAGRVRYLQVLESPQRLRRVAVPNSVDPFYCTALGRAIVAFLPEAQRALLLRSGPWAARTEHTVTDPTALSAELNRVARQGYSIEKDQTDLGVTCIAAPIFEGGTPIAAVSISLPTVRSDATGRKALITDVRTAAKKIENHLQRVSEKDP
jgi:DNA-binding IclR family transcriptional regulator